MALFFDRICGFGQGSEAQTGRTGGGVGLGRRVGYPGWWGMGGAQEGVRVRWALQGLKKAS